jgi:hypothetical protein
MDGIPGEPSTPGGGWLMRVDALTFVRIAFNMTKEEAEKFLLDCACGGPSFEWRYQRRFTVGESVRIVGGGYAKKTTPGRTPSVTPEKKRAARFPDFKEIDTAIRTAFWRQVRDGLRQAKDNSATYAGLVFLASPSATVRINGKFETGQNLVMTDSRWWIEIHLSVIQFAAAPLIAAVRKKDGLVDAAIEKLRSLGRLPPAVTAAVDPSPTDPSPTPDSNQTPDPVPRRGKTDRWVAQMLGRISSKGYTQANYVDEVLVNRNSEVVRKTLVNSLSRVVRDEPKLWQGVPPDA